jgi:anti-sigma B factor antagonist
MCSKSETSISSTGELERNATSGLESQAAMATEPLEVEWLDRGVLSIRGPLTMENVTPFLNAVRRETAPTMILDFSGVPYLDSSGLGSLVSACTSCAKAGRRIALTGVNKRVLKVFEITKVENILLMFPTLADAIEAFTNAGTA